MRAIALCLLLVPALLGTQPAPLHADDDDGDETRLERRVEMLIDLVAEVRAEVRALRERVAQLEAERDGPVVVVTEPVPGPPVKTVPATPLVPAPIVTWADVSGVYGLDNQATIEAMIAEQLEDVDDEEVAEMLRQGIASDLANVAFTLRIEKDGSFFVRVESTEETDGSTARGTWTRDASQVGARQRLLFVTTHEDGVEETDPTQLVGTWEDGRLVLKEAEEGGGGFVMVFRRN